MAEPQDQLDEDEYPLAPRWADLDPDAFQQAWRDLVGWVRWLVDRYELTTTIPECWHQHGTWIEDLSALRVAWHAAYDDETTSQLGPLQFQEALDRAITRWQTTWKTLTGGCTPANHKTRPPAGPLTDDHYWVQVTGRTRG